MRNPGLVEGVADSLVAQLVIERRYASLGVENAVTRVGVDTDRLDSVHQSPSPSCVAG